MRKSLWFAVIGLAPLGSLLVSTPSATGFSAKPLGISAKLAIDDRSFRIPLEKVDAPINQFLRPNSDWGAGHRGVDFYAEPGQSLLAPHAGKVTLDSMVFGVPTVVLERADGSSSVFQPSCLQSGFERNQEIAPGEAFALICEGTEPVSHCRQIPCLHWGFRIAQEVYLNPLKFTGLVSVPVLLKTDQALG